MPLPSGNQKETLAQLRIKKLQTGSHLRRTESDNSDVIDTDVANIGHVASKYNGANGNGSGNDSDTDSDEDMYLDKPSDIQCVVPDGYDADKQLMMNDASTGVVPLPTFLVPSPKSNRSNQPNKNGNNVNGMSSNPDLSNYHSQGSVNNGGLHSIGSPSLLHDQSSFNSSDFDMKSIIKRNSKRILTFKMNEKCEILNEANKNWIGAIFKGIESDGRYKCELFQKHSNLIDFGANNVVMTGFEVDRNNRDIVYVDAGHIRMYGETRSLLAMQREKNHAFMQQQKQQQQQHKSQLLTQYVMGDKQQSGDSHHSEDLMSEIQNDIASLMDQNLQNNVYNYTSTTNVLDGRNSAVNVMNFDIPPMNGMIPANDNDRIKSNQRNNIPLLARSETGLWCLGAVFANFLLNTFLDFAFGLDSDDE